MLAGETYSFDSEDDPGLDEYANKHILQVVSRAFHDSKDCIQTLFDGSQLTAGNLRNPNHELTLHRPIWVKDSPESIGMKVPKSDSTFREIAQKIGMRHPISVMDVKHQDELDGWVLEDMVLYFEDDTRSYHTTKIGKRKKSSSMRVLNQISLEFSLTPFRKEVRSPTFVRDMDFIDKIWPRKLKLANYYPRVQYYFLTSTRGCYTDFHVDFGGTSVWYHIISGRKIFLLIPPTETNLRLYEDWLCRKDQNDLFFPDYSKDGDLVDSCFKVTLEQGNSFIIPTGWIHAVFTPMDSLVIGGNFLHGLDLKGQIDIHCIESRTRVPKKFRFPFFKQIMLYAAADYFKKIFNPNEEIIKSFLVKEEVLALPNLVAAARGWVEPAGDSVDQVASMAYVQADCVNDLSYFSVIDMEDMLNRMDCEVERLMKSHIFPGTQATDHVSAVQYKVTKVFSLIELQHTPVSCDEANCNLIPFCTWTSTAKTKENYNYCLDCTWKYFGGCKVGASEFPDFFDPDHRDFIRSVSTNFPKRANILRMKEDSLNKEGTSISPQPKLKIRIKTKTNENTCESLIASSSTSLNVNLGRDLSASMSENKDIEEDFLPDISTSISNSNINTSYSRPNQRHNDLLSRNDSDELDEWVPTDAIANDHDFISITSKKSKLVKKNISASTKTNGSSKARLKKKLGF